MNSGTTSSPTYNYGIRLVQLNTPSIGTQLKYYGDSVSDSYDNKIQTMVSNGRVGIGTTSPVAPLSICGTSSNFNESTVKGIHMGLISGHEQAAIEMNGKNHAFIDFKLENGGSGNNDRQARIDYNDGKLGFETGATDRMTIDANGNIGIGTTSPSVPLHVYGSSNSDLTGVSYTYIRGDEHGTSSGGATNATGAIIEKRLWVKDYVIVSSDERIKNNIIEIKDDLSLKKLRDIQCYSYNYIDNIGRGDDKQIGFLAQQVGSYLPEAVTTQRGFIPNVMKMLEHISWTVQTNPDSPNKFIMSNHELNNVSGVKYKFYVRNDLSDNEVEIEVVGNENNMFVFDKKWKYVFCYGKEVEDFHTLDKAKLFAINFSATQEIDKIQQEEKEKVQSLEIKLEETEAKLKETESQFESVKQEMSNMTSIFNDLLARVEELEKQI